MTVTLATSPSRAEIASGRMCCGLPTDQERLALVDWPATSRRQVSPRTVTASLPVSSTIADWRPPPR